MQVFQLLTEVFLTRSHKLLGKIHLNWTPQPGAQIELAGQTYIVLERHHRYQLKAGIYQIHRICLYVQPTQYGHEKSWIEGRWTLGNANCRFNAHSEVIRCAVHPEGPCEGCHFYEQQSQTTQ